ncbi:MAG: ABC transporter permease, partial [Gemmatimonadetes bacterium]|nr:ABC transporter permease [Gemmatimonadota bacterium]
GNRMTGLIQDVRYALRAIRRNLGFFVFAVLIIGIGVGANTAVFSVMSPLMLRPLPFEHPEELVWVANNESGGMSLVTSRTSNLRDFRAMNQSFEAMTGYMAFFEYESYNLTGRGRPERLVGVSVARDFLEVLGVEPMLGRNFVEEEGIWDGRPAAILTHGFWTRRFGADPDLVGSSISLNDIPTDVVGVLPSSFDFASTFTPASQVDFLRPFPISDETDRRGNTLAMIGRLKPGATVASAQAELDIIVQQLQEAQPGRWGLNATVSGLQDKISGRFRSAMLLLAAAAGAVMLIVCANLSNLLLARSTSRQKEMAVRSALGASRRRLLRQLLIESLVLSLCGAVIGVLIAFGATRIVAGTTAISIPMLSAVSIDTTALLFTLAVAMTAGVVMGIVPALQISGGQESAAMRDSSRGSSEGKRHTWIREMLVIAEVALACVLLVGGGLLMRSFVSVLDVDMGYRPDGVVAWRVDTRQPFENLTEAAAFYDRLLANVEALPGVEAVGFTDTTPLGRNRSWGVGVRGILFEDDETPTLFPRIVDHRYLQVMQIPLLAGRYLTADDNQEAGNAVVINETAARQLFQGQDALGQALLFGGDEWEDEWEIVGVVGDVRHQSLEQGSGLEMYLSMNQMRSGTTEMVVRSPLPPESLVGGVRAALQATDPTMPTDDFRTLNSIVDRAVSPRRFILVLLGAFAGTALLLAALGIYGIISFSVTQRTREIGIRIALGAQQGGLLGLVLRQGGLLILLGVTVGIAGALALSRYMGSILYEIEPTSPITYASVTVILVAVAGLASYLPARRAMRVDPKVAFTEE